MGRFKDLFCKKKYSEPAYDTSDRYQLEHLVLPMGILGESGANILKAILEQKGNFFIELYNTMNKDKSDYICRYSSDDFKIHTVRLNEKGNEKLVIQIQMPKPERTALCSSIYIVHDENFENRRYITVELSGGGLVICEWNGSHRFYGNYSEELLRKILFA